MWAWQDGSASKVFCCLLDSQLDLEPAQEKERMDSCLLFSLIYMCAHMCTHIQSYTQKHFKSMAGDKLLRDSIFQTF